jgi:hypothetical protein
MATAAKTISAKMPEPASQDQDALEKMVRHDSLH